MMPFLLDCTIEVSVIMAGALVAMPLLRTRSAAIRHCVLAIALFCAAIVPFARIALPAWNLIPAMANVLPTSIQQARSAINLPPAQVSDGIPVQRTIIPSRLPEMIWLAGLFVAVSALAMGALRLAKITSRSEPVLHGMWAHLTESVSSQYRLRRRVRLLQSRNPSLLVTWGARRPKVLLPAGAGDWPEGRARVVLCHELAHVRRGDWLIHTLAEVLWAIYWFNPLVWMVCRRLRLEGECACDDAVLAGGMSGSTYAAHLLEVVRTLQQTDHTWSSAMAMAGPSTVERRFKAMLNPRLNRRPVGRVAFLAIVIVALGATLPLAALHSAPLIPSPSIRIAEAVLPIVTDAHAAPTIVKSPKMATKRLAATIPPVVQEQKQYTGKIVTLDFDNLEIRDFFRLISNISGLNVALDPSVSGTVTMRVTDVPWDQALDIVLKNHKLTARTEGNVMYITTQAEAAQDAITLRFELYKDEALIGQPILKVANGGTGSLDVQGFPGISVTAVHTTQDTVATEFSFKGSDNMRLNNPEFFHKRVVLSSDHPEDVYSFNIYPKGSDTPQRFRLRVAVAATQ